MLESASVWQEDIVIHVVEVLTTGLPADPLSRSNDSNCRDEPRVTEAQLHRNEFISNAPQLQTLFMFTVVFFMLPKQQLRSLQNKKSEGNAREQTQMRQHQVEQRMNNSLNTNAYH